jgi:PAS domain S-box-containing protein
MSRNIKFRFRIIVIILVLILAGMVFATEIYDLPNRLLGAAPQPYRWRELFFELAEFLFIGMVLVYVVSRWESGVRETEEKIEQSRKLLLVILEGSPVAILLVKNNKAIWASKSIEDILGWHVDKWLEEPSISFCYPSPEEYERVNTEIIYKDIARKGRIAYEYDYVHKDGHRVPTLVKIQALNKDNLEEGLIFSVIDNSDHKKAEEVIKKLNQGLEQKVKERTSELAEKINELERFKEATVDRELRMKELRDEIELLKKKAEASTKG